MSIIRRIPEGAPHSVGSKSLKRDRMKIARGSPEWYQRLVDYYLSRREPHAAMWDLVEARYLHDRRGIRGEDESFLSDEIRVGRVYSIVHTIESMVFSRRPKFFLEGWHGRITKEEVPALAAMLRERGLTVALYDPFYAPDESVWSRAYDFITATEVLEHLHEPARELDRLFAALRPGGWLGVMTKPMREPCTMSRNNSRWRSSMDCHKLISPKVWSVAVVINVWESRVQAPR